MGGVQEVKKERVEGGSSKNAGSSKYAGTYTAMQNICNQIEGLMGGSEEKGLVFLVAPPKLSPVR